MPSSVASVHTPKVRAPVHQSSRRGRVSVPPPPVHPSAPLALLTQELLAGAEQLSAEILSAYGATQAGRAYGTVPLQRALEGYFLKWVEPASPARAMSRKRVAELYADAGLDLGPHFETYRRLLALVTERALGRPKHDPSELASLLIEVQRHIWEEASLMSQAFTHARERRFREIVSKLAAAQTAMAKLAQEDPLTGVRSRASLVEALQSELERARRYNESFALLFADLDHFKSVNDAHGHTAGDQVLRQIALLLQQALRPQDVLGRYGGDEFVMGLVRADTKTAKRIAERFRSMVEAAQLPGAGAEPFVTVSIGVVSTRGTSECLVELLRRADDAMYAAKAGGRNRVHVAASRYIRDGGASVARARGSCGSVQDTARPRQ